jgi:hypothetical protein
MHYIYFKTKDLTSISILKKQYDNYLSRYLRIYIQNLTCMTGEFDKMYINAPFS